MFDDPAPKTQSQAGKSTAGSTDTEQLIKTVRHLCTQFRVARVLLKECCGEDKARLDILNTAGSSGFAGDDNARFRALLDSLGSSSADDRWIPALSAVLEGYLVKEKCS